MTAEPELVPTPLPKRRSENWVLAYDLVKIALILVTLFLVLQALSGVQSLQSYELQQQRTGHKEIATLVQGIETHLDGTIRSAVSQAAYTVEHNPQELKAQQQFVTVLERDIRKSIRKDLHR